MTDAAANLLQAWVQGSVTVPGLAALGDPLGLAGPVAPSGVPAPETSPPSPGPQHNPPRRAESLKPPWAGSKVEQTPDFPASGAIRRGTGRPPSSPPRRGRFAAPLLVLAARRHPQQNNGARPAESELFLGEQLNNSVTFYFRI